MKEVTLLTWLTQLGLSVAFPLAGCIWLAVWLRDRYALGKWVLIVGIVLGAYLAVHNGIQSLKALSKLQANWRAQAEAKKKPTKAVYFNDHD